MPDIRLLPSRSAAPWTNGPGRGGRICASPTRAGPSCSCAALLAIVLLVLLVRAIQGRRPGGTHIALPALLPLMRDLAPVGGAPRAGAAVSAPGVPFFAIALADPHTGFTREEVSYPGRRIALLVDASTSMVMSSSPTTFKTQGESTFFTAVAAAEAFIQRRMNGPYHDLVALIQFGNQAYVVTPFTTDYENILLSIRLISDPREWGRFSDWGTTIIEGHRPGDAAVQGVRLHQRLGQPDGGVHRRARLGAAIARTSRSTSW